MPVRSDDCVGSWTHTEKNPKLNIRSHSGGVEVLAHVTENVHTRGNTHALVKTEITRSKNLTEGLFIFS